MKLRLYMDEDSMGEGLVQALRLRGVDLVTALDMGMVERSDALHLEFATAQGRALFSYNRSDYMALHTQLLGQGRSHAGIILSVQRNLSIGEQMRRLLRLIGGLSAEDMVDRAEFLNAWG